MSILDVTNLSHTFGDKKLFNKANLVFSRGDKLGLTGLNGAGKSTFIGMLTNTIIPDEGYIKWNPKVKLGYLDQHASIDAEISVKQYLSEAYRNLFDMENEMEEMNRKLTEGDISEAQIKELVRKSGNIQENLESAGFYGINSAIDKVASGLGITAFGISTKIGILSGGQRAKVMLAKLLLTKPDVLLLDEPNNFLDKEHIEWLGKYLSTFKGSFILVSHDYQFLNTVVNCVCDIEFGAMTRYVGNYESFTKQKEQKKIEYVKNYNTQQKKIARLEDYVARNIVRASTSAMAKSRRKTLEKIDRMDKPQTVGKPSFVFQYTVPVGKIFLKTKKLSVGYTEPLVPEISFNLEKEQKLAITGFNGIGKSTLLKTLCGIIPALNGEVWQTDGLIIGYYEQEHIWQDPKRSAMEEIHEHYRKMTDKEIRSSLARCAFKPEQVMQPLHTLSGGEQAKVKLCKMTLSRCNLLILDEPTNHLDVNAIEHLKSAVINFEGSVIFVSHSKEFIEDVADSVLDMEKLFD